MRTLIAIAISLCFFCSSAQAQMANPDKTFVLFCDTRAQVYLYVWLRNHSYSDESALTAINMHTGQPSCVRKRIAAFFFDRTTEVIPMHGELMRVVQVTVYAIGGVVGGFSAPSEPLPGFVLEYTGVWYT